MNKVFALALVVMLGAGLWGCANEDFPAPLPSPSPAEPPRTLVYTDALQQGGPGYVDVYQPPADVNSGIPVSAGFGSAFTPRRPSIIAIHGGGWTTGGRYELASVATELASNGYVVFAPDYSLAPQVEWPAPLVDLQALVRYMRANATTLQIDPQRIGAWGIDAGGQLASLLALCNDPFATSSSSGGSGGSGSSSPTLEEVVVTTGRVRGVVTVMAAQDLTIPGGLGTNEDSILRDLLGAPRIQLSQSQLLDASPIHFARPDASALIIHGTNDQVVSIDNSEHLNSALVSAGADVNFIRVYGGGHDASTYHATEAWASTLQFFQTRLSGGPTPLSSSSSSAGK